MMLLEKVKKIFRDCIGYIGLKIKKDNLLSEMQTAEWWNQFSQYKNFDVEINGKLFTVEIYFKEEDDDKKDELTSWVKNSLENNVGMTNIIINSYSIYKRELITRWKINDNKVLLFFSKQ